MGMDVSSTKNKAYFRANCWSWRPIHELCVQLNKQHNLHLNFNGWNYNDGAGLHTKEDCEKLALVIENHIKEGNIQEVILESTCRINSKTGIFLGSENPLEGKSAYYIDAEHILKFAKFLRECDGEFEIW